MKPTLLLFGLLLSGCIPITPSQCTSVCGEGNVRYYSNSSCECRYEKCDTKPTEADWAKDWLLSQPHNECYKEFDACYERREKGKKGGSHGE